MKYHCVVSRQFSRSHSQLAVQSGNNSTVLISTSTTPPHQKPTTRNANTKTITPTRHYDARFHVVTAASTMTAFWDTVPCSLVEVDRRFRGAYCLHHQGDHVPSHHHHHITTTPPTHNSVTTNVVLDLTLLLRIREVPGSIFYPVTGYPDV
jgi:hypothetical protein